MSEPIEKLLPQNVEAEAGVLGSIEIDPDAVTQVLGFLLPEDFYRHTHRLIYAAIRDLWAMHLPADLITLCDELQRRGQLDEVGGISYVQSLANQVPTSANAVYYAQIVHRCAVLRRLISAAGKIAAIAYSEPDADVASIEAHKLIREATQGAGLTDSTPISAVIDQFLDEQMTAIEQGVSIGVQFGLTGLHKALGGLKPGELLYLCGRPGSGKSVLAATIAWQEAHARTMANAGTVEYVTLEMQATQVVGRVLAGFAGVDTRILRANFRRPDGVLDMDAWRAIRAAADDVRARTGDRLRFWDKPIQLGQLRAQLERAVSERACKLAIIDYIGLMRPDERTRDEYERVTNLSRDLKQIALELRIPIICLVQMNRQSEYRPNPRPKMSDIRDSGGLEQDGDFILGIYRGAEYLPKTAELDPHFAQFCEVNTIKARESRNNVVIPLRFEAAYTRMSDWPLDWDYRHYLTMNPGDDSGQRVDGGDL